MYLYLMFWSVSLTAHPWMQPQVDVQESAGVSGSSEKLEMYQSSFFFQNQMTAYCRSVAHRITLKGF